MERVKQLRLGKRREGKARETGVSDYSSAVDQESATALQETKAPGRQSDRVVGPGISTGCDRERDGLRVGQGPRRLAASRLDDDHLGPEGAQPLEDPRERPDVLPADRAARIPHEIEDQGAFVGDRRDDEVQSVMSDESQGCQRLPDLDSTRDPEGRCPRRGRPQIVAGTVIVRLDRRRKLGGSRASRGAECDRR